MMHCGYKCHKVGGPWVAENPACPVHGVEGQRREVQREQFEDKLLQILIDCWHRQISADDAYEEIMNIMPD